MSKRLALALIHYPVFDGAKKKVATNITNFDIHDIARVTTVYGVDQYYIVHPALEQLMFVSRVLDHWRVGQGQKFNPMRKTALDNVMPIESLEKAISHFSSPDLQVITTSAKPVTETLGVSFKNVRESLKERDTLLVFGTGFGLCPEVHEAADFCLEPIRGYGEKDYRHLSVRSAVSICLDRLRGAW